MRKCKKCQEDKSSDQFFKDKGTASGFRNQCKSCENARTVKWRKNNKTEYNAQMAQHRRNYSKELKTQKYGITVEQWQALFDSQSGLCAICKQPETNFDKRHNKLRTLSIDHCHITGKVRGLLCGKCNNALGLFNDDPNLLDAGSHYLKNNQ